MTAPTLVSITETAGEGTGTSSYVMDLPTTTSGDLLLIVGFTRGGATGVTVTCPTDWTELRNEQMTLYTTSSYVAFACWLEADGTEGATATVTSSASTSRWKGFCYRFQDIADPSTSPPEYASFQESAGTDNINPPNLTPAGGSKDYYWLAEADIVGYTDTVSTYPTDYTNTDYGSGGSSGGQPGLGIASLAITASSEDPGQFTTSDSSNFGGFGATFAIYPVAGGASSGVIHSLANNGGLAGLGGLAGIGGGMAG